MKKHRKLICITTGILLIVSVGLNICLGFFSDPWRSYLQSPEQIYTMESGALERLAEFGEGEDVAFTYDMDADDYAVLLEKYQIDVVAGSGTEFERARNLMDEYSGRLKHKSTCENIDIDHIRAVFLLAYALDDRKNGINCRMKAQILNEMCLALGIYSRKVWLNPLSKYDQDCHVVNEVWDSSYQKWIMLDITSNTYWVDREGTPLSIIEIREHLAEREFCTPVAPYDELLDLERSLDRNYDTFLYIAKNMVYMSYLETYGVGETTPYYNLFPRGLEAEHQLMLSVESVEAPPKERECSENAYSQSRHAAQSDLKGISTCLHASMTHLDISFKSTVNHNCCPLACHGGIIEIYFL